MKKIWIIMLLWGSVMAVRAGNYPFQSNVLFVTTPDHTDWLYKTGENANVTVAVYLYGMLQDELEVKYAIGPEQFPAEQQGSVKTRNGVAVIQMGTM